MEMEQVRPEPVANAPEDEAVDRDRLTLEALEGELAVLEDELARVDADRADPPGEQS